MPGKTKTTKKRKRRASTRKAVQKEKPRKHSRLYSRYEVRYLARFVAKDPKGEMLAEGSGIVSNISLSGVQIMQPQFMGGIVFPCPNFEIHFEEGPLSGKSIFGELITARDYSGRCAFGVRFKDGKTGGAGRALSKLIKELEKTAPG
jgi:hypothetical protein